MNENQQDHERPHIKGVIDRIENSIAVIKLKDGQEFIWSKEKLAPNMAEGSHVRLIISNDAAEKLEREKLAKTILNEILKGSK